MASCCCWPAREHAAFARQEFLEDREKREDTIEAAIHFLAEGDGADVQVSSTVSCGKISRPCGYVANAGGGAGFAGKLSDVFAGERDVAGAGFHHAGDAAQRGSLPPRRCDP